MASHLSSTIFAQKGFNSYRTYRFEWQSSKIPTPGVPKLACGVLFTSCFDGRSRIRIPIRRNLRSCSLANIITTTTITYNNNSTIALTTTSTTTIRNCTKDKERGRRISALSVLEFRIILIRVGLKSFFNRKGYLRDDLRKSCQYCRVSNPGFYSRDYLSIHTLTHYIYRKKLYPHSYSSIYAGKHRPLTNNQSLISLAIFSNQFHPIFINPRFHVLMKP